MKNIDTLPVNTIEMAVLKAESPAALLLSDSLTRRWEKLAQRLGQCQVNLSEENVHDLRVSIRRMLAMLSMCRAVNPGLRTKSLRRELKSHLDNLDALRDIQVMQLFIKKYLKKVEAANPLLVYLMMQETQLLRRLGYEISLIDAALLAVQVNQLTLAMEQSLTGTGIAGQILSVVDEAYANALWMRVNLNPADLSSIHAMRIAFKKFRYMLEVASPLVPPMPSSRPKVLHRYQAMMGDIQDVVVMRGFVDRFSAENPQFDVTPVQSIVERLLNERKDFFLTRIAQVKLFWRKSPASCFPWRVAASVPSVSEKENEDE